MDLNDHEEFDDFGQDEDFMEMPEYDMEFATYGPNTIELPLSPPRTPPPDEAPANTFAREPSPFSDNTSMTSVDSTESVGQSLASWNISARHSGFEGCRILPRRGGTNVFSDGEPFCTFV